MHGKFALFCASMTFGLSPFISTRRQKLAEILEDICPELPEPTCCQELLEVWSEEYGFSGLLLGNLGLFLLGLLLTAGIGLLIRRFSHPLTDGVLPMLSACYCLWKFRTPDRTKNLLCALFIAFWLISGFSWLLCFVFLIAFTNLTMGKIRRDT